MSKSCLLMLAALLLLGFDRIHAQTPSDGLMMSGNVMCQVLSYSTTTWSEYWEGANKRINANLGSFSSQSIMAMGAYGITDDLNVIYALPYVTTGFSDSYLTGYSGVQDVSLWLKYKPFSYTTSSGDKYSVFLTGGVSTPTRDYVVNQLPLSIGMGSSTASLRGVLDFRTNSGWYVTAQAGYTNRGSIKTDETSYFFNGELYYTSQVPVPDAIDATVRIGYRDAKGLQADIFLDRFACADGDDIRYNLMPTPTVRMQSTSAGIFAKYNIGNLGIFGNVAHVLAGRNVGRGTAIDLGFSYIIRM
ncbi:MAG: hypothetical protein FGM33_04680 [Candidatus Kapabacteria bacterium]|nr:hypothetical protein [Candidatus Kapabacteria bacterium]